MTPALFKRPDATYIVALAVGFETGVDNYYLDYRNGRRSDVSTRVVPNFSKNNVYELPQKGATAGVFKRNGESENDARGEKLYDLVWKNGKFSVKR